MRAGLWMCLAVVLGSCSVPEGNLPPVPTIDPTPVILVSIDTLRSDRLAVYGYAGVETPAIDALRADGILYRRAYTPAPLTLPAHVSIFTGLLPPEHGVRDNIGYPVRPDLHPMVQQRLSGAGYATGAAVSAWVLRASTGIATGFDRYDDAITPTEGLGLQAVQRPGPEALEAILPWLRSVAGAPFFLFLHLFEPHSPYAAPEPYRSLYADPYDAEIAAADAVVGRLIDELNELDVYDRALIILLSDHGEGLGEHGEREHGVFLYRSTLQVPLILKLPMGVRAGALIERPVSLVDVAPTILTAVGLSTPPANRVRSLLESNPADVDSRTLFAETLYPRLHFGWSDLASVIRGDHQYIDAPRPELYDLVADPGQHDNRIDAEAERSAEMSDLLAGWAREFAAPGAVNAEERARLEALGYVGATAPTSPEPMPDPKDRIHVLEELRAAQILLERGDAAAAVTAFDRVLQREPGIEDAWVLLIRARRAMGDLKGALLAVSASREELPESDVLRLEAASLLVAMGRFDDAEPLAAAAVGHDPATAHVLLAQVYLSRGAVEEAERAARLATVDGPDRPEPWLVLAEVFAASGRVTDAVGVLNRVAGDPARPAATRLQLAEQLFHQGYPEQGGTAIEDLAILRDADALRLLAHDAVRRQDWDAAREHLEVYLESTTDDPRATVDLGLVLLAQGEADLARRTLESGLELDPSLADGWNALGAVLGDAGDLTGAIRAWENALRAEPRMMNVHYNLAMAKARSGHPLEAARHLEVFAASRSGDEHQRLLAMAKQLRAEAGQ